MKRWRGSRRKGRWPMTSNGNGNGSIASRAMLVRRTVTTWTGRRFDKQVSREVALRHVALLTAWIVAATSPPRSAIIVAPAAAMPSNGGPRRAR